MAPQPHPSASAFASASPLNLPSSSTRASSSTSVNRDTSMLFIGQACHLSTCRREDFLPVHCPNCGFKYCAEHYQPTGPTGHECDYRLHPERKGHGVEGDFIVPSCPLCHEPPRGWKRGQDVTEALHRHFVSGDCADLNDQAGREAAARAKKANQCQEKRCQKNLIVKMDCEKCHGHFCPNHRVPRQHACVSLAAADGSAKGQGLEGKVSSSSSSKSTSLAGLAALKRQINDLTVSSTTTSAKDTASTSGSSAASAEGKSKATTMKNGQSDNDDVNLFGFSLSSSLAGRKVDKRIQAEHLSALRSLQTRRQRGVKLSDVEEQNLAALMAEFNISDGGSRRGSGGGSGKKLGISGNRRGSGGSKEGKEGDCTIS